MKKLTQIAALLISSILVISCQNDSLEDSYNMSDYAQLHTQILSAELSIYQDRTNDTEDHLNTIVELLQDTRNLFCPFQNVKIEAAQEVAENLISKSSFADLNYKLDQLRLLKRNIYNLDTENEVDFFILYLWNYEEQMYYSTKAAMDPKLDLYEWNEFEDEVKCLAESWDILNHHYPSPETLDYDQLKYKTQVIVKDELKQATNAFITLVIYGQADMNVVYHSAQFLRNKYLEYLEVIVTDPMKQYAYSYN